MTDATSEQPYLVELRGGPADRMQFTWPSLPQRWMVPESPRPLTAVMITAPPAEPRTPPANVCADYRPTGAVTNGGAHLYEFIGYR